MTRMVPGPKKGWEIFNKVLVPRATVYRHRWISGGR